jgi:hypothetical protein
VPNYVIGIDLAQHVDHSALAIVEKLWHCSPVPAFSGRAADDFDYVEVYRILYLKEWPLGTIPQVVLADLADMILRSRGQLESAMIAYDATGIGASWAELFRRRHMAGELTNLHPRGYTVSGEQTPSHKLSVRKIDLMSKIQVCANERRLELDPDLYLADRFAMQLQAITAKPTSTGRLSFGAPQATHDDLVTAVSLSMYARSPAEPRMYGTTPAPAIDPLAG